MISNLNCLPEQPVFIHDCQIFFHPFLFPFPGGVPPALLGALIYFNEKIEKAPFFRWQCSNVFMQIEFEK